MNLIEIIKLQIIKTSDINKKIRLLKELGGMLWANNVGIYNLNSLERAVIEDVARDYTPQIGSQYKKKKNNVFVITIGYMSGGHTRLMENLANMLDNKCDLIITGNASVTLKKRLEKYFNEIFEIPVYNDTNINELYKLSANLERYENIILNIHPDDIASVIIRSRKAKMRTAATQTNGIVYLRTIPISFFILAVSFRPDNLGKK